MRLFSVTIIILRLFAVYWFVAAFFGGLSFLGAVGLLVEQISELGDEYAMNKLLALTPMLTPLMYLVFSLVAWFAAGKIAKRIVRGVDCEFEVREVSPANLYALGILVVGLYFFLTYLGGSLGWIHFLAVNQAGDALIQGENGLSIYEVISQAVPCVAGLYFAVFSERFGRRLASVSEKVEQVTEHKSD